MANFCSRCGRPMVNGKCPSCVMEESSGFNLESAKAQMESMKNRMGIGDPELNKVDVYEKEKQIIPDCVRASEGEVHVKQYTVAKLRNRIFGITYAKAIGRMQVTNKRVIFRAPGKSFAGRTTLQHEFAIDELAGVEARREYSFNVWDLIIGFIVALFGGAVVTSLIGAISQSFDEESVSALVMACLFGIAGCIPFFALKKKWLLKLLCLGCAFVPALSIGAVTSWFENFVGDGISFFGVIVTFVGLVSFIFAMISLFVYAIKPNLVLIIKTKSASEAIDIRRKKICVTASGRDAEHTGYTEVIPSEDAESCIREINAMITDIQKLGDFGIEKWRA